MSSARIVLPAIAILITAAAVAALVSMNKRAAPEGPVPIVWDREVCAHCRMHIGEPSFASQLHTTDNRVLNFDDPGCLFKYLEKHPGTMRTAYFRDHDSDDWLGRDEVAFAHTDVSPMGFEIMAVQKNKKGARDWEWALEHVSTREGHHIGTAAGEVR